MLAAYIVLDGRKGIATIFDTYLLAVAVALIAAELDARDLVRAEKLIHVLLAANAALALFEYAVGYRFFPFRFEGVELEWDMRSTGLSGHPLENAQLTSIYIMALLAGGGASMPAALRPAAVLLQLAAMVPFGGRTATLLTLAMMTLWLVPRIVHLLRGGRMSLVAFASVAILVPVLALAVGAIAAGGFFDVLLVRFVDDSGSAKTRLEMFEIFSQLSAHDILVGANPEMINSMRRSLGLELGIENPVVRLLLYQGAIFTGFLIAGLTLFIIEIVHRLRPGYGMALICICDHRQFLREHFQQDRGTRAVHRSDDRHVPSIRARPCCLWGRQSDANETHTRRQVRCCHEYLHECRHHRGRALRPLDRRASARTRDRIPHLRIAAARLALPNAEGACS